MSIVIELSGVPVGKGRPRFRRVKPKDKPEFVSTYTPAKTAHYEGNLALAAQVVMAGRPPLEGALSVSVRAYFPVPKSYSKRDRDLALSGLLRPAKRPDWENLAKTLDAFNQIVWRDDSQVVDGRIEKHYAERPRLRIEVTEVMPGLLT